MSFNKKIKYLIGQSRREDGNALFLILIAVALFAGLSYAVTQSGRSSGQSVSDESSMILSSQVMQYPAGIRTGITRMLIRGTSIDDLSFNPPGSYGTPADEVFHPSGGGVAFQEVIQDTVDDPESDFWVFDETTTVTNIATTSAEVVALLPNVRGGVCEQVNEAATGDRTIPAITPGVTLANLLAGGQTIEGAATTPVIDGQPFLCVETSDGANVYYHVLVER